VGCLVKQRAQDPRPHKFELAPKLGLGTPVLLANRPQGQKNRPIGQIQPANDILDAVQEGGARRLEQHLFIIRVELPDRETALARKPAERIREPGSQAGQVIEGEEVAVLGGNHQFALLTRECSDRGHIRVDQRPEELR
jgi:hypothetical protein